MGENNQETKGLLDMLEESLPAYESLGNSQSHEEFMRDNEDELRIELLVQDMFLDHFFP